MRNAGLGSWPARRAAMSPGHTALIFGDRRTTYAQLHERIARLAAALHRAGVRRGDRVEYLGPNHPSFVETMFATWTLGAIFVPLNFRLTQPEIAYQLEHSGAVALIHASPVDASVRTTVALSDFDRFLAAAPEFFDEPVTHDDVACILYTSGTTGHPKGAMLTHGNLIWNCYNLLVCVDVASDEVTLVSAPLFHVAALNQCLLPTFLKGATSVIMPAWDVDGCFDAMARHRITWMFGVSAMFAGLSQSPRWPSADLTSVRCLMTGGASVPEALIRTYQERGLAFCSSEEQFTPMSQSTSNPSIPSVASASSSVPDDCAHLDQYANMLPTASADSIADSQFDAPLDDHSGYDGDHAVDTDESDSSDDDGGLFMGRKRAPPKPRRSTSISNAELARSNLPKEITHTRHRSARSGSSGTVKKIPPPGAADADQTPEA